MPAEAAAKSGDVAIAGKEGRRVASLIDRAEADGTGILYRLSRQALSRLFDHGPMAVVAAGGLFSPAEVQDLTGFLASIISTGDLLGRSRLLEKMQKASAAGGLHRFADDLETPWAFLPETIPLLPPEKAIAYFARLFPSLAVRDPARYGSAMQRTAFTLAQATEQTILNKVQNLILDRLRTGEQFGTATHEIERTLTDAGIHPTNPQYSEMVFRTNMMDAYNVGQVHEIESDPAVRSFFPVWQYLGIRDGREGEDHRPHFDKYFPAALAFHTVRGPRVFNCRCTPRYIDQYQWAELQAKGARLSNV